MEPRSVIGLLILDVINRFIFGHAVAIYYLLAKISKNAPCFPSQLGNRPCTIVFILTAAAVITPHIKSYEIAAMTMHSFVKFNFYSPSVSLRNAP